MTIRCRAIRSHASTRAATICLLFILMVLTPLTVRGQLTAGAIDSNLPWRIHADTISYNQTENEYQASGNVLITQGDKQLSADQIRFNRERMMAWASGNVHFTAAGDSLVGDRLEIDLDKGTGTLYNGIIFIEENNFFIKGDRIEKTGEATYRVQDAGLTACEQKTPDWRITGSDVNVTIEGFGTVRHAAFWVKQVPVFYTPYFIFPVKGKRQSGLLFPQAGYSDRNGLSYEQPFFWAISDSTDATFYYHHIQNRGEKPGVEYRYMLSEESQGSLFLEGFDDREVDNGVGDASKKWGYDDDSALRPNSDRYWFRMKADQEMGWDVKAKIDLDVVSDQDYLREFDDGYTGFDETEDYFESEFGRDLDDKNDPVRENRLNFNRNWTYSALNADIVWYDDVIKRRRGGDDDTLQRLPMISYSALKQPVLNNLIYTNIDTEYDHFYREDGISGHRTDIYPKAYLPLHMKNYFTLEPSVGLRQTAWYTDAGSEEDSSADDYAHRELYDVGAELSTDLNRIFPVSVFGIEKIKHTITPKLEYRYLPYTNQNDYPDFDEIDRIENRNGVAFSMTHFFTSKRSLPRPGGGPPDASYNMFARFLIEQPYDFEPRNDFEDGPGIPDTDPDDFTSGIGFGEDAPWQPLYMELDFTPVNLITLHADTEWSHNRGSVTAGNLSFQVNDPRGDVFRVEYRYTREFNKSVYFEALVPITYWLSVYGDYERNLMDGQDIELQLGTLYRSGCWSIDLSYQKEENDRNYAVLFNLYGLGEVGSKP